MSDPKQAYDSLQEVRDIRRMMENSSRFTSLSGLSSVAAGICALAGAAVAHSMLSKYYGELTEWKYSNVSFQELRYKLILLAGAVFVAALLTAFYFTWKKSRSLNVSVWGLTPKKVFWNMAVPLGAGALFVFGMLQQNAWQFVAPGSLVFYGLALVNTGKYTVSDIRSLGYCEIILGLANLYMINDSLGYGFYFWVVGFGILHIIFGIIMWWKYDRKKSEQGSA